VMEERRQSGFRISGFEKLDWGRRAAKQGFRGR